MINESILIKIAKKLNISDFEDNYLSGVMLNDAGEQKAKKMYAEKVNNSFALRHPYLTGIPTLGIAPTIAGNNAKTEISRTLLRENASYRGAVEKRRKEIRKENLKRYQAEMSRPVAPITNISTNASNTMDKQAVLVPLVAAAVKAKSSDDTEEKKTKALKAKTMAQTPNNTMGKQAVWAPIAKAVVKAKAFGTVTKGAIKNTANGKGRMVGEKIRGAGTKGKAHWDSLGTAGKAMTGAGAVIGAGVTGKVVFGGGDDEEKVAGKFFK